MTVQEILETMEYGPAPESAEAALAWIEEAGGAFGHFIGGLWTEPGEGFDSRNPATGDVLARLTQATQADIDAAVAAARAAQPAWEGQGGPARARVLYALARLLQKHARLFSVLEVLDNGKPIREARDIDVPLAIRHFYYHAGMAQLMEAELPDRRAHGVCGQIVPWNFPLLMLAWKVAPALATGNAVVLKPAEYTSLTALLFAQVCQEAGVPPGVVNIVTGDGAAGRMLVHAEVDKIAFTGSTAVGREIRRATAGSGKALTLELGGKSPYIVFDDADLDSAVEGLVDAIWFNAGQVCCAGSRLLVQEGVAERLHHKLKARMDRLRMGDPLDKSIDLGAVVDPVQLAAIRSMVDAGGAEGDVYHAAVQVPEGCYYPPTLVTGLAPSARLMQEEIFGPVLVSTTFRTPSEAVALANDTRYGLAASVWSENVNLALDVAPRLAAGVVWVNGTNFFDAAAGFGGVRESGFGREGGWEGLGAYLREDWPAPLPIPHPAPALAAPQAAPGIDRTAKMYVGGKQARPDGGYSRAIRAAGGHLLGHVGVGNRKDIRNAVDAAERAEAWSRMTGHSRAQILYYVAENLAARTGEFAARIDAMTGGDDGSKEVEAAIRRLFTWAAWADKHDGAAKGVPMRGLALALNEPIGVIGALCPAEAPLLGLISAMGPAVATGNRVVLIPSEPFPLAATDFYQVLDTSDVPAGVVNIVTGAPADLAPVLAAHAAVGAVWNFADPALTRAIEEKAADTIKRTWSLRTDWHAPQAEGRSFLRAATEVKTVWVPFGE
ncbi:aldehyde dehydrogenase family protein [Rhodovulum sp. 12E13]|uniref:aldehyde dehydrogenase family protein n=1 Tax=Rhodovulum sp. 12E13 TaxID=2203891 RepID=UPI000E15D6F5|nr:aldehyde dehydrogenase family protein [Rhodovulum sp. 12E13]RDC74796.1 aldehyde dehydrogenase family protein [Rhodovulum sp. 12E13]